MRRLPAGARENNMHTLYTPAPRKVQPPDFPPSVNISELDPEIYVDTVTILTARRPSNAQLLFISSHCSSRTVRRYWKGSRRCRIRAHVPYPPLLRLFEQWRREKKCILSEVHVACDWHAEQATKLRQWLDAHIVQPFRHARYTEGRGEEKEMKRDVLGAFGGTSYLSRRRWRVTNFALYCRRSKLTGRWCAHAEYRLCGAQVVRRAGFRRIDAVPADAERYWRKRFRLEAVDRVKLSRIATRGKVKAGHEVIAAHSLISYARQYFGDEVGRDAQCVRLFHHVPGWKHVRAERINRAIDVTPFLPPGPNSNGRIFTSPEKHTKSPRKTI